MKRITAFLMIITGIAVCVSATSVCAGMQVAAGGYHSVGLKADSSVVAVGADDSIQCAFQEYPTLFYPQGERTL